MQIERLRIDEIILGYRKKSDNYFYYSKDLYGWSGREIQFKQLDLFSGLKDKNNKHIFEHDIIQFNQNYYEVFYDKPLNKFYLLEFYSNAFYDMERIVNNKNFIFYSYSFIQKA